MANKILKIGLGAMVIYLLMVVFIPIDRTVKPIPKVYDLINVEKTESNITNLLVKACYDCHSFETKYPSYAYWAPISWGVSYHVEQGRKVANFSLWGKYDKSRREAIIRNSIRTLLNKQMPTALYMKFHPQADLTPKERIVLTQWFETF